ncbi:hypothetical protein Goshw_008767, partial [Gossypium schwendimanii]|nr:hypothetical protein [Gossypium schwendimanii]
IFSPYHQEESNTYAFCTATTLCETPDPSHVGTTGESITKVCEEDNPSPPLSRSLCNQPECEHHCALRHPKTKAWGKCKFNDDRFVCDCCYLCDHHSLEAPSYNARKLSYAPSY